MCYKMVCVCDASMDGWGGLLSISGIRDRGRGRSVIYGETTLWHFISLILSIDCSSEVGGGKG